MVRFFACLRHADDSSDSCAPSGPQSDDIITSRAQTNLRIASDMYKQGYQDEQDLAVNVFYDGEQCSTAKTVHVRVQWTLHTHTLSTSLCSFSAYLAA